MDGETPGFSEVSSLLLTCSTASMIGIKRVIFSIKFICNAFSRNLGQNRREDIERAISMIISEGISPRRKTMQKTYRSIFKLILLGSPVSKSLSFLDMMLSLYSKVVAISVPSSAASRSCTWNALSSHRFSKFMLESWHIFSIELKVSDSQRSLVRFRSWDSFLERRKSGK